MIAIIVSENEVFSKALSSMISGLGYHQALITHHVDEASFFFEKYNDQIKLIIFEVVEEGNSDLPLARLIIQKSELNFVPLIFVSNRSPKIPFLSFHSQDLSRIDRELMRPFTFQHLKQCIALAHERRSLLRNRLIYFGSQHSSGFFEAILVKNLPMHWQEVNVLDSLEGLQEYLAIHSFRVGGILIEPGSLSKKLIDYLAHYKKTTAGIQTPYLLLSTATHEVEPFRLFTDLYYDISNGPDEILSALSRRILYGWEIRDLLVEFKALIKIDPKGTEKRVQALLKKDGERWELRKCLAKMYEIKGDSARAIENYKRVLVSHPCDPATYLGLIELSSPEEKVNWIFQAKLFCPNHPQINGLRG